LKPNEGEFKSKEKKFILLKKIDENIPESSNKIQNLNNEQLSMQKSPERTQRGF
jgi:hypothetical protein